nr:MAG TPA: hypothetical protein [Caudoviricetes sp.]
MTILKNRWLGTLLNLIYPFFFSVLFLIIKDYFKINYSLKGYENILESIITFSSIIIGFFTAMYGVLITLKDSDVLRAFRRNGLTGILKYQLYDSLTVSFLVLVISVIMQGLENYPGPITGSVANIWTLLVGYFIATSFRAITLLLKIVFHPDDESNIGNSSDVENPEDVEARYRRLSDDK